MPKHYYSEDELMQLAGNYGVPKQELNHVTKILLSIQSCREGFTHGSFVTHIAKREYVSAEAVADYINRKHLKLYRDFNESIV